MCMSKIIRIFLNQGFTPADKEAFRLGTCIEFNCYIQRFKGFVILLEAGTFLDEKMYGKLTLNDLQIFVQNSEYAKYKEYKLENKSKKSYNLEKLDLADEIEHINSLHKELKRSVSCEEKLRIVYFRGKNFLNAWFDTKNKIIDKEVLEEFVFNLLHVSETNELKLSTFNDILEAKYSLAAHSLNVAFYTVLIASKLFLGVEEKKNLILSAVLHDLGKTDIDEALLDKPDMLEAKEFEIVKQHASKSAQMVNKLGFHDNSILRAIKEHHERLDGSGYPLGTSEVRIYEFAKIIAVADVFDALTTVKPYRGAYSTFNALMLIKKEFKNKLDLKYVAILIKLLQ